MTPRRRLLLAVLALLLVAAGACMCAYAALSGSSKAGLDAMQGLHLVARGQMATASADLQAMLRVSGAGNERYRQAIVLRRQAWDDIEQGWKLFEAWPQTPAVALHWQRFLRDWASWQASDAKQAAVIAQLARDGDRQHTEEVLAGLRRDYAASLHLLEQSQTALDQLRMLHDVAVAAQAAQRTATLRRLGWGALTALGLAALPLVLLGAGWGRAAPPPASSESEEIAQLLYALREANGGLSDLLHQARRRLGAVVVPAGSKAGEYLDLFRKEQP